MVDQNTGHTLSPLEQKIGEGMDLLLQALADHFRRHRQRHLFCLPPEAGRLRAEKLEPVDEKAGAPVENALAAQR